MLTIGGLTPFTTIDYPGRLAAVIFCQGCPWRCAYCHNRHLLDAGRARSCSWDTVLDFLSQRRGLLDAVVFSGGEPTAQSGLAQAISTVRLMGFLTGLHTAGPYPDRLLACLPHLDWVGMDLKAPFDQYDQITGRAGSGKAAEQSAALLRCSGVPYQFRTTVAPLLQTGDTLARLQQMVAGWGCELILQPMQQHDSLVTPPSSVISEPTCAVI